VLPVAQPPPLVQQKSKSGSALAHFHAQGPPPDRETRKLFADERKRALHVSPPSRFVLLSLGCNRPFNSP
jgi:hypothetical protein